MDFRGSATALGPDDLKDAGKALNIPVAVIAAVIAVEAAGKGFDAKRRPKILFEPHIFYRELGPGFKRDGAAEQGLAYEKWGTMPYPGKMDERYAQIDAAAAIDPVAALRSASWGLPQIMGFNHGAAGYATVFDMVDDMKSGEGQQIKAFARLLVTWGLDDALRAMNWEKFALAYNGPKAIENGYPDKLIKAYAKQSASVAQQAPKPPKPPKLTGSGLF
jgi:N-acetylmuramidase